jgi:hypothetical protein
MRCFAAAGRGWPLRGLQSRAYPTANGQRCPDHANPTPRRQPPQPLVKLTPAAVETMLAPAADAEARYALPADWSKFTAITADAAALLAARYQGEKETICDLSVLGGLTGTRLELNLSGLQELDVPSAAALARWNPEVAEPDLSTFTLDLSGLTHPSPEMLSALANWKVSAATASLVLDGIQSLDESGARALGSWSGGELRSFLQLNGVRELTPAAAARLCAGNTDGLSLGVTHLSEESAAILGQSGFRFLELRYLEVIDRGLLHGLGGLTPEGKLRPEQQLPPQPSLVDQPILALGNAQTAFRGPLPGIADAIQSLQRLWIEVVLSPTLRGTLESASDAR